MKLGNESFPMLWEIQGKIPESQSFLPDICPYFFPVYGAAPAAKFPGKIQAVTRMRHAIIHNMNPDFIDFTDKCCIVESWTTPFEF